jgi:hypothetical protein
MPPGAPDGHEDPFSLSANGAPNAFEAGPGIPPHHLYVDVGSVAYWRSRPPDMPVGRLDPGQPVTFDTTVNVPVQVSLANGTTFTAPGGASANVTSRVFPDTGAFPPANAPFFGDYHNLDTGLSWGFAGTIGYRFDNGAVEFAGFFIPDNRAATQNLTGANVGTGGQITINSVSNLTAPPSKDQITNIAVNGQDLANAILASIPPGAMSGRLDLPFFNPPGGFGGDNGQNLWLQADRVFTSLSTTLGNLEFNYRYWPTSQLNLIAGLRYVLEKEDLQIFTQDDDLAVPPDPTKSALYRLITHNRVLVGQLGFDGEVPIGHSCGLGGFFKGGWGTNFATIDYTLTRGDGLVGFDDRTRHQSFSHMYETGVYLDVCCFERCRLHAGYNCFWLVNVAEAVQNINYNLSQPAGQPNFHSSLFYHGPVLQLEFLF